MKGPARVVVIVEPADGDALTIEVLRCQVEISVTYDEQLTGGLGGLRTYVLGRQVENIRVDVAPRPEEGASPYTVRTGSDLQRLRDRIAHQGVRA